MNKPLKGYATWDNHPDFPVEDWIQEVCADETRRGYWEWVRVKIEENDWDEEEVQDV